MNPKVENAPLPVDEALHKYDKFTLKYVYGMSAGIVRVPGGAERNFDYLSHHVEQRDEQGQWQLIKGTVLIEQGTDRIYTYVAPFCFTLGLAEEVVRDMPPTLKGSWGHNEVWEVGTLPDTQFRFLEVVYSRSQLIEVFARVRPYRVGVLYPTAIAGRVIFHETSDAYGEWITLHRWQGALTVLATKQVDDLTIRVYQIEDQPSLPIDSNFLIGYERHGPERIYELPWQQLPLYVSEARVREVATPELLWLLRLSDQHPLNPVPLRPALRRVRTLLNGIDMLIGALLMAGIGRWHDNYVVLSLLLPTSLLLSWLGRQVRRGLDARTKPPGQRERLLFNPALDPWTWDRFSADSVRTN